MLKLLLVISGCLGGWKDVTIICAFRKKKTSDVRENTILCKQAGFAQDFWAGCWKNQLTYASFHWKVYQDYCWRNTSFKKNQMNIVATAENVFGRTALASTSHLRQKDGHQLQCVFFKIHIQIIHLWNFCNTYKHAYPNIHLIWQLTCAEPSTQWAADGWNGAICHHQSQGGHLHFLYLRKDKGMQWKCKSFVHMLYHSYSLDYFATSMR